MGTELSERIESIFMQFFMWDNRKMGRKTQRCILNEYFIRVDFLTQQHCKQTHAVNCVVLLLIVLFLL